jgi:hypothetical protein
MHRVHLFLLGLRQVEAAPLPLKEPPHALRALGPGGPVRKGRQTPRPWVRSRSQLWL